MHVDEVASRAKRGFTASLTRQLIVQSCGFVTTIVLARFLAPKDFGVFGLVSMIVQFISTIASTGLATAVIRNKEEPSRDDLDTVFTCELIGLSTGALLLLGVSAFLPRFNAKITPDNIALIWALYFSTWLTVFRLLPSVYLQRKLEFTKIALVETVENLAFNAIAIFMAIRHTGAWALVAATMTRSITGAAFLNFLAPVRPRLTLVSPRLKSMLAVGLGFQTPAILFFLKDLAMPGFIAATLGPTSLGYFVWVRDFTTKFGTFGGLFAKIAFPTMAKLSAAGGDLAKSLRKSTVLLGLFYWPITSILVATSSFYIHYVFSDKWFPAQPLLIIYVQSLFFQSVFFPRYSLCQAKSPWHWPFKVALGVGAWDICGGILLIKFFGLPGCGVAVIISWAIYMRIYYVEVRRILADTYRNALVPWKGKFLMNCMIVIPFFFLVTHTVGNLTRCLVEAVLACLAVGLANWFLVADNREMLVYIANHFRPKTAAAEEKPAPAQ